MRNINLAKSQSVLNFYQIFLGLFDKNYYWPDLVADVKFI
jgi:hypothetical protein